MTVSDDQHVATDGGGRRRRRRLAAVAATLLALVAVGVGTAAATTASWGSALRDDQLLLEGITIGGVDVSGHTTEEAVAAVEASLAVHLDHEVTVAGPDRSWTITPRQLGATSDADEVVAQAFAATTDASLVDLARLRFGAEGVGLDLEVSTSLPDEAVRDRVDEIAQEVDLEPTDAELVWTDAGPEVTAHATGHRVERDRLVEELTGALGGVDERLELPLTVLEPAVPTATVELVRDTTTATIDAALDRSATVTHAGSSWTVTPRDLEAVPDVEPVLDAARQHVGVQVERTAAVDGASEAGTEAASEADGASEASTEAASEADGASEAGAEAIVLDVAVPLSLPDGAVEGFVATVAAEFDRAAVDATVELVGDRLEVTPERTGTAVDREAAHTALRAALDGSGVATVELRTVTTRPSVTTDSLGTVLLVRQGARTLEMYENGEVTRSWPVAVGSGGHPTPTGTFTVGAKRFEPTWTNPSPDGWGVDMPASIGPGDPANPLGDRAINWNRSGADTLIRFHGTPNEASIGQAVSKGCVRMYNADVAELFDLVSPGTTIISVG